jgi:hypothetical protein
LGLKADSTGAPRKASSFFSSSSDNKSTVCEILC